MAKTVLVVDDAPQVLDLIEAILKQKGYDVLLARDGEEALSHLKKNSVDLIIADVLMEGMDGYQFYKSLKKFPAFASIPVIILTARAKMADTFQAAGVKHFLVKPIQAQALVDCIESLLSPSSAAHPPPAGPSPVTGSDDIVFDSDEDLLPRVPKVLIFGKDELVMGNMRRILEKKGCLVHHVSDSKQVVPAFETFQPTALILELRPHDELPTDKVVYSVNEFLKEQSERFALQKKHLPIVLFRVHEPSGSVEAVEQEKQWIQTLVEKCAAQGRVVDIGVYNAMNFYNLFQEAVEPKAI